MELEIYICQESVDCGSIELTTRPAERLSEEVWQQFAANVAKEISLTAYPAEVLAERWQQGRAAVAMKDDEIISYISLVPVLSAAIREKLSAELLVELGQLPTVDINESATGWTHPAWRQRGLSFQLRCKLFERFAEQRCLYVTIAVGLGAGPVVSKLNWQLVAWGDIPFVSSLVGLPLSGLDHIISTGRRLPPGMKLYRGELLAVKDNPAHPWDQFCHLWVSDLALAQEMNQQFSACLDKNLPRWRLSFAKVLMMDQNPRWKPFLFDEDYG